MLVSLLKFLFGLNKYTITRKKHQLEERSAQLRVICAVEKFSVECAKYVIAVDSAINEARESHDLRSLKALKVPAEFKLENEIDFRFLDPQLLLDILGFSIRLAFATDMAREAFIYGDSTDAYETESVEVGFVGYVFKLKPPNSRAISI